MITGILNSITIILPSEKFLLFNKFIEDEIEPIHDSIKDPIKKLISKENIFSACKFINMLAIGIEIKKLMNALDNDENEDIMDLTSNKIKSIKNDILQKLQIKGEELKEYHILFNQFVI